MRPDTFEVRRNVRIAAPPEKVYALIGDFRRREAWSPWERKGPAMKREIGGAPRGKGAFYAWSGNADVGTGRMELVDATPPSKIAIRLVFTAPFATDNRGEFVIVPREGGSEVSWTMRGAAPFTARLFHVFVDMDALVGGDFAAGLAAMKEAAERLPARRAVRERSRPARRRAATPRSRPRTGRPRAASRRRARPASAHGASPRWAWPRTAPAARP